MQTSSTAGKSETFQTPKDKDIIPIIQENKVAKQAQNYQSPREKRGTKKTEDHQSDAGQQQNTNQFFSDIFVIVEGHTFQTRILASEARSEELHEVSSA